MTARGGPAWHWALGVGAVMLALVLIGPIGLLALLVVGAAVWAAVKWQEHDDATTYGKGYERQTTANNRVGDSDG